MTKRRKMILVVAAAYVLGIAWGYVRLPLAALKNLAEYPNLNTKATFYAADDALQMTGIQRSYLDRTFNIQPGLKSPKVWAKVKWNWGVAARVDAGVYFSPQAAEGSECVYVCAFGVWIPVYTYSHVFD